MATKAILVQGSTLEISNVEHTDVNTPPLEAALVSLDCSSRTVAWASGAKTEIDVTAICSTAKEFLMGLKDSGTFTISGFWNQGDAAQQSLKTADGDNKSRYGVFTFADGSTFASLFYVSGRSWTSAVDGAVEGEWTFRCTGETVETAPPVTP